MIINNSKNIEISLLDNVNTIKNKIAYSLNTLPRFLIFESEINLDYDENINVTDLLEKVYEINSITFPLNHDTIPNNILEELEEIFISSNPLVIKSKEILNFLTNLNTNRTEYIYNNRSFILKKLKDDMSSLKISIVDFNNKVKYITNIKEVDSSNLNILMSSFDIVLDKTIYDIHTIFNNIILTERIPFAMLNNFIKYRNSIKHLISSWIKDKDKNKYKKNSTIILKLQCSLDFMENNITDLIIRIENNEIICTVNMIIKDDNLSKDNIINIIFSIFNINPSKNIKIKENNIVSSINYSKYKPFIIPYFLHVIMNNKYLNDLIYVNEFFTLKKRQNIYIYVTNTSNTISISEKTFLNDVNDSNIFIRIKASNIKESHKYVILIGKLLNIYNNSFDNLYNLYTEYIPSLNDDKNKNITSEKKEKKSLKNIAPDIFLSNYSRKCLKQPIIINEDEIKKYEDKGFQVLSFPLYGESKKRYYVCNIGKYIYPGLRKNTLSNNDIFPYIPCCYIKDQNTKKTNKYNDYINKKNSIDNISSREIFTSNKILNPYSYGSLSVNLDKMFKLVDTSSYTYFRFGFKQTNYSFLENILYSLNIKNYIYSIERKRDRIRNKIINNLYTQNNINAGSQEMINLSKTKIEENFKNSNYDSLEFVRVFEEYFDCSIFIFGLDNKNTLGTILIPYHKYFYYRTKPRNKTIFILRIKSFNTIQHELIVRCNNNYNDNNDKYNYWFDNTISDKIWDIFKMKQNIFINNTNPLSIDLPIFIIDSSYIKEQYIDNNGKCRILNINYNSHTITIVCDPIQPYSKPIMKSFYRNNINIIKQFCDEFNITIIKYCSMYGEIKEVSSVINSFNITFLTDSKDDMENLIENDIINIDDITYSSNILYNNICMYDNSILDVFNNKKKLSLIILSYSKFILSKYIKSNNITDILSEEQMLLFVKKHFVINTNFEYSNNYSNIFRNDIDFIDNSRIIISSKKILNKLVYILLLSQKNNFKEIKEYYNKKIIENFFIDISDFDKYPDQIISTIEKFNTIPKINTNIIYDEFVDIDKYLYKNNIINNNNIYLVMTFNTYDECLKILAFWDINKYIPHNIKNILETLPDIILLNNNIDLYTYKNKIITKKKEYNSVNKIIKNKDYDIYNVLIKYEIFI